MAKRNFRGFFFSIILPAVLAIVLFVISIYVIIIPVFEKNMLDRKKEMIAELTNTAWSLIEEYEREVADSLMSLKDAKNMAAEKVGEMRYGKEKKDYFWIIDNEPKMIMHPYMHELVGRNLYDYTDPKGKRVFVEAVKIVDSQNEGYIDYLWQWKDDSSKIVPKLSYVKGFEKWGWIVGTGIYLEDVNDEIKSLEKKLIRVSLMISLVICIMLLFIIRQSLKIEKRRKDAEHKLKQSRQKYQSLVEASIDGTLMMHEDRIVFSNQKFNQMIGIGAMEMIQLSFDEIFDLKWKDAMCLISSPNKSATIETRLKKEDSNVNDVVITISKVKYAKSEGFIVIVKDVSQQRKQELDSQHLSDELQTSILLMNQPIKSYIAEFVKCELATSIEDAALLMTKNKVNSIFVAQHGRIIGVITDSDLRKRVIAEKASSDTLVSEIMTSPVISIQQNALLYEAQIKFTKEEVSCLLVKDEMGVNVGMLTKTEFLNIQHNFLLLLLNEIEIADNAHELKKIHERLPSLINALIESGGTVRNITRIITSVSDAIVRRIIDLSVETLGLPPCKFAFISMGSEGRKEQTLTTDQDNAVIFENCPLEKIPDAEKYFWELAKKINKDLDFIGYKYCNGEVMANNPKWNQPLDVWKDYFKSWIINSDPHGLLEAAIFFDFRHIYGEESFANELQQHINELSVNKAVFFQHLAHPIIKYKTPVNIFGKIVGQDAGNEINGIDVKKVLLPIIGFVRCYAIKNKLLKKNTLERLFELYNKNVIDKAVYEDLLQACNFLMNLRFKFQSRQLMKGKTPSNIAVDEDLSDIEKGTLKRIYSIISTLQSKLSFDFKGTIE